ncbi:MAG: hypothetical protein H6994_11535 [Pseudomonadales bacterium]|nr:hypothetical protein [Pseudomonadales bacterium]
MELESAGELTLQVRGTPDKPGTSDSDHVLHLHVDDCKRPRRLAFDMRDGHDIDQDALATSDIYFKRSYDDRFHRPLRMRGLPIVPYGFNYGCTATDTARQLEIMALMQEGSSSPTGRRRRMQSRVIAWCLHKYTTSRESGLPSFRTFERSPDTPREARVIYLTRLWSPASAPGHHPDTLEALNQERIDVVRRLQAAFGSRFTGGLEDNTEARRRAPEYIYKHGTGKKSYVSRMKQHLVGVTSMGLHGSVGWKFAEYIAAACSIVAPPLPAGQSSSFKADINYLPWQTLDDCVHACDSLLANPDLAYAMQQANARFYTESLRPDALVRHCIDVAMTNSA